MAQPHYSKLTQLLEQRIQAGEFPPGSRIPSERALCELYGVSRITVRQAIADLVHRRVLTREHGRGTFVAPVRVEQSLLDHFTFAEGLRERGLLASSIVAEQRRMAAPAEVATHLDIPSGADVAMIVRQRLADGQPYALETTYLPSDLLPGVEQADLTGGRSLYEVLARDYSISLARASETFEPVLVKSAEAAQLDVRRGSPGLLIVRTTYADNARAIEFAKAVIRGDRCRMLLDLKPATYMPTTSNSP